MLIDGTKVGEGHPLLMVALAYRHRSLSLAWTRVKGTRGHSLATTQCALFAYIRTLLPAGANVLVVGDSEFGSVELMRHFGQWGWVYVLRLSRLTLLVALLYLWCIAFGAMTINRGLRYLVDRADRRDLSIFRIGLDMIERCLTNGKHLSIRLLPLFEKVYGH